jgi:23S rRNA (adenine2030-N6)-methyltransferase
MNYQHCYHAGNFADVLKHVVFISLIDVLQQKDSPYCVMDAHAGLGYYVLQSDEAQKTQEYVSGVLKLLSIKNPEPPLARYISLIQQDNPDWSTENPQGLSIYPGSPWLAYILQRPNDRLILNEKHPVVARTLKSNFKGCLNTSVHTRDAYECIPALLPPKERRGIILFDPPFEESTEWASLTEALESCTLRFPQGIYLVWFPIKDDTHHRIAKKINKMPIKSALLIEFSIAPWREDASPLKACGLFILNPPWNWEKSIEPTLIQLSQSLKQAEGAEWRLSWVNSP